MSSYINDTQKPLIFLGSNDAMYILTEACEQLGIQFAGIIDKDYYGNFILFNEQYALLPIFYANQIELKMIPYYFVSRIPPKKQTSCIFHYDKNKLAYKLLLNLF